MYYLRSAKKGTSGRTSEKALFVTTCSEHSKPYMILVSLIKGFQNHIGFAIIRASGEECQARDHQRGLYPTGYGTPERVKVLRGSF